MRTASWRVQKTLSNVNKILLLQRFAIISDNKIGMSTIHFAKRF